MSVNTAALSGHLVENATLRSTKGGTMVLNFTVAVTERVRGADGGYEDRPSYIDCAVFGARAEAISRYLTKGTLAMVQGHLRQLAYTDRQGQRRSKSIPAAPPALPVSRLLNGPGDGGRQAEHEYKGPDRPGPSEQYP